MATKHKNLKVTLIRSPFGRIPKHRLTLESLGLKRMNKSVVLPDLPSVRGMVNQINYLLKVEECD